MSQPGKRRVYSNYGFEVLAEAVQQASGIEFGQYLAEAVFEPLGMESTDAGRRRPGRGLRRDVDRGGPGGICR